MILMIMITSSLLLSGCDSLTPDDSGAYGEGLAALANGDYDTALERFQKAAEEDGRLVESYRGQGMVYFARGNYEYAVKLFDMALEEKRFPNEEFEEDVKYYKAESLEKSGQIKEAILLYEELVQGTHPDYANALIGRVYLGQGEEEKAFGFFDAAIEGCSDYGVCLLIYDACRDAHLEADGTAYLKQALAITPYSAKQHAELGQIYDCLEDDQKAIEELQKAVDQGYMDAVPILGSIYLDNGNIAAARSLYEDAVRSGLEAGKCYNGLALCALAEGRTDTALQYINEGLKSSDDTIRRSLLFNEVIAYETRQDFQTARDKAREFLQTYPNDEEMKREYKFLLRGLR